MWNYSDYRLVTKQRDFHRLSRQLNFKRCEIVTPESCVIELQKTNVVLSKPRYVGVAVLGISKYLMGDFHYNYIMKNFDPKQTGRNVKLLMTDTDSFVYDLAFPPQVVYPMLRRQIAPYMDFPRIHLLFQNFLKKLLKKAQIEKESNCGAVFCQNYLYIKDTFN